MGCQAEEATVSSTNLENHANHRHINFEKFSELFPQPASKILQQNDKSTRALGRNGVYDPVNDFTILTDEIFMAEKDGEIYFTFAITRENGDFSGLENLVLSSDGLGGFTPALAKYAITEAEKDKLERGEIVEDIAQKASIVPLENVDFGGISISGKVTCYTLTITWCGGSLHHPGGFNENGSNCEVHKEMTVSLGCDDDGGFNSGGPGGNYPGTPSPGSGAGGGGGGSAPYVPPTNGNPGNPPSNGPQDPGTGMNPGGGSGGGPKKPLITNPLYIYVPVPPRTIDTFLFYLSAEELSWLNNPNNSEAKNAINAYVASTGFNDQSMDFGLQVIRLGMAEPNQEDVANLTNLTLLIENSNSQFFTDEFAQSLAPFTNFNQLHIPNDYPTGGLTLKVFIKYKKLRQINPEWSRAKCIWYATKEIVHLSLDAFGLIPVVGEIADVTNGVLYTIEGDGLNATLSYASAVPVVGWATIGVKYSFKVVNTAYDASTRVKLVWQLLPDGTTIFFGSPNYCRATLRKVLGMGVGNANQAHHIIPLNLQTNPIIQKAAKSESAFHMNEALNGIPLSTAVHNGSHAHYDGLILSKLQDFSRVNPNATPNQCYTQVNNIINQIRTVILNNPNTPINQLNF